MSGKDKSLNALIDLIEKSVKGVIETEAFKKWFQNQNVQDGDLVIINNSFIYRKPYIKTSKNEQYLSLKVNHGQACTDELFVTKPIEINSDFKLFVKRSQNLPSLTTLKKAVLQEVQRIGSLIFVLIGALKDVGSDVALNHSLVKSLKYDHDARNASIEDAGDGIKVFVVNQLTDPEAAWNALKEVLSEEEGDTLSSLETAFAQAYEKLREEAHKNLILPKPGAKRQRNVKTLLSEFLLSVNKQRELYKKALTEYTNSGVREDAHLREAMRIAYNFADDAIKVIELLVSIADLKAVLLWCTIKEHFNLAEAFRELPWTKSLKKPSLERYREIISGARNRAFHNLLALDRTVVASLEGVQVGAKRLTLFPPYGRRKNYLPFDYEDREIIQVLSKLTRSPETTVPLDFWKKNEKVMEYFENLLKATEKALWSINSVRSA